MFGYQATIRRKFECQIKYSSAVTPVLDTHARRWVQPVFEALARMLASRGVSPVAVTLASLLAGLAAAGCIMVDWTAGFLVFLWLCGLLDAVDGTLARLQGRASRVGALIDIVCDRAVEAAVIVAFGARYPEIRMHLLALCAAVILSLTVFLTAAAALPASTNKSFHYQAGLTERTEGFLFFSLMALWPGGMAVVTLIFAAAVLVTAGQRLWVTVRFFRD